jgi:D-alanine-D-alanine ligase
MTAVALVFGGRSVEHRVSGRSARTVAAALAAAGHEVVACGIALDGSWVEGAAATAALEGGADQLSPGAADSPLARLAGAQVAFPLVHGTWGEDGTLQGFFEILDLPYVGAGVSASAVAMDKALAKAVMATAGVPVVDWEVVSREDLASDADGCAARLERLGYPLFAKPSVGGSSVGVRKVTDPSCVRSSLEFALRFDERVVVERAVSGRELECAVLGHRRLEASVVGEIVPGREFYDYADKYLEDTARLDVPARLPEALSDRLRELAVRAFASIGGHGMARVDFLLEGETPYVNEINTLPGFTSISMYPKLWEATGLPIDRLVDRLVEIAVARHAERRSLNEGILEWVHSLDG